MKVLIEKIIATGDVELMDKFLVEAQVHLEMHSGDTVLYVGNGMIRTEVGIEDLVMDQIVKILVGKLPVKQQPVLSTETHINGVLRSDLESEEEEAIDDKEDKTNTVDKSADATKPAPTAPIPATTPPVDGVVSPTSDEISPDGQSSKVPDEDKPATNSGASDGASGAGVAVEGAKKPIEFKA